MSLPQLPLPPEFAPLDIPSLPPGISSEPKPNILHLPVELQLEILLLTTTNWLDHFQLLQVCSLWRSMLSLSKRFQQQRYTPTRRLPSGSKSHQLRPFESDDVEAESENLDPPDFLNLPHYSREWNYQRRYIDPKGSIAGVHRFFEDEGHLQVTLKSGKIGRVKLILPEKEIEVTNSPFLQDPLLSPSLTTEEKERLMAGFNLVHADVFGRMRGRLVPEKKALGEMIDGSMTVGGVMEWALSCWYNRRFYGESGMSTRLVYEPSRHPREERTLKMEPRLDGGWGLSFGRHGS